MIFFSHQDENKLRRFSSVWERPEPSRPGPTAGLPIRSRPYPGPESPPHRPRPVQNLPKCRLTEIKIAKKLSKCVGNAG